MKAQAIPTLESVGAGWVAATLVFEFGFGRLVQRKPWSELLSAYTFADGNLWPLVLIALLIAPACLAARTKTSRRPGHQETPGSRS